MYNKNILVYPIVITNLICCIFSSIYLSLFENIIINVYLFLLTLICVLSMCSKKFHLFEKFNFILLGLYFIVSILFWANESLQSIRSFNYESFVPAIFLLILFIQYILFSLHNTDYESLQLPNVFNDKRNIQLSKKMLSTIMALYLVPLLLLIFFSQEKIVIAVIIFIFCYISSFVITFCIVNHKSKKSDEKEKEELNRQIKSEQGYR